MSNTKYQKKDQANHQLKLLQEISDDFEESCWCVSWSPDGEYLAVSGTDKIVRIYCENKTKHTWQCIDQLEDQHSRTIRRIQWSPNGDAIACASFDGTTSVWKLKNHPKSIQNQTDQKMRDDEAAQTDTSTNQQISDSHLNTTPRDESLRAATFTTATSAQEFPEENSKLFQCVCTLEGHENEVKGCAWDNTGQLLATCGRDKKVWIWEAIDNHYSDFDCLSVCSAHTQDVKTVIWHPKEELLFSASYDNTIRIWKEDDDDWASAAILDAHEDTVWSIALDLSGDFLVSSGDDLSLIIWRRDKSQMNVVKYEKFAFLNNIHNRTVYCVDWHRAPLSSSSSSSHFSTSQEDNAQSVQQHNNTILIATVSGDNSVSVYGLTDQVNQSIYQMPTPSEDTTSSSTLLEQKANVKMAHNVDINSCAWNPKRFGLLATCSDDGVVKLWQYE